MGRQLREEETTLNSTSNLIHSAAERQSNGNVNIWDNNEKGENYPEDQDNAGVFLVYVSFAPFGQDLSKVEK